MKGLSNRLKRWLSRDRLDDIFEDSEEEGGGRERKGSLPIIMHKQTTSHVDVNCTDEHGSTPLIIAALNGKNYDKTCFHGNISHIFDKRNCFVYVQVDYHPLLNALTLSHL